MSNQPRKHVSTLLPDIPWNILRGSKLSLGKSVLPHRLPAILRVSPCWLRLVSGKYLHAGMLFRSLLTFPPVIPFARCPGSNPGCLLPMQFCSNHVRPLHGCKWTPWLLSSSRRHCAIARSARRDRHFNHKATHQLYGGCRMPQASFVSGHNACVARLVAHGFWAAGHTPTVAKAAW